MEAAPPSYDKATSVKHWDLIARYVPSEDLCSACLVCSAWHTTFSPQLWGSPASHFGTDDDRVHVALTCYKRILPTARLLVRSLTHTLHLPPAHAELYDGPHADWLREVLERLPHLQSLIVRGLPFFDHAALQLLKYVKVQQNERAAPGGLVGLAPSRVSLPTAPVASRSGFSLRFLDCSRCLNVTAHGLAQALERFKSLLYLDLSFTYPAKQPEVLTALRRLGGLQVLKLRNTGLTDDALFTLAEAVGLVVRSLDIRNNLISDRGVRGLLDRCFVPNGSGSGGSDVISTGARSPALLPHLGSKMLEIYQGEDFEGYLRNAYTGGFVSRLAFEDSPRLGLTHLYIAGNNLTVDGAGSLIQTGRLHVLDLDSVGCDPTSLKANAGLDPAQSSMSLPGAEKLVPILAKHAAGSLSFMRIVHDVVTRDVMSLHHDEVGLGRVELADTSLPELSKHVARPGGIFVPPEAFALSAAQTPRTELKGDPTHSFVSSTTIHTPATALESEENPTSARGGSALTPEALPIEAEHNDLANPYSLLNNSQCNTSSYSVTEPPPAPEGPPIISSIHSFNGFPFIRSDRHARLFKHTSGSRSLHPAMLPHLKSIVLTNVPSYSQDRMVTDRLIEFIKQCAEESFSAKRQARLDYSIPPGRKGNIAALKHSATRIFALERLVLELESEELTRQTDKTSPWQHLAMRSMTEDRDSEALWSAAETDFSFFDEGEDGRMPDHPEPSSFPRSSTEEQVFSSSSALPSGLPSSLAPKFDTVALLSKFRHERKLAHQQQLAAGAIDAETEGYWEGLVQVVRRGSGLRNDEDADYHGVRCDTARVQR
nr:hypothetical protein CFP56_70509 [Quercus suber]